MAAESDPAKIFEARPPPHVSVDPKALPSQLQLTETQQALYDDVLKHFDQDGYVLPGVEDGALTEAEKFWLVRPDETVIMQRSNACNHSRASAYSGSCVP